MASMTSSTTKHKNFLSTVQTTDNHLQLLQQKRPYGQRLRKFEGRKRRKKKPNKAKLPRRRRTLNVGHVARLITPKSDYDKVRARISNRSAPDPRTHPIIILIQAHSPNR